jgi:hypothetical protein
MRVGRDSPIMNRVTMSNSTSSDNTRKPGRSMATGGRSSGRITRAAQIFGNSNGSSGTTASTASTPPRLTIRR